MRYVRALTNLIKYSHILVEAIELVLLVGETNYLTLFAISIILRIDYKFSVCSKRNGRLGYGFWEEPNGWRGYIYSLNLKLTVMMV